jgi:hypothetical protein
MEPEGSLPHSQELSTCSHLSQASPVHVTPFYLYKIHLTFRIAVIYIYECKCDRLCGLVVEENVMSPV